MDYSILSASLTGQTCFEAESVIFNKILI